MYVDHFREVTKMLYDIETIGRKYARQRKYMGQAPADKDHWSR